MNILSIDEAKKFASRKSVIVTGVTGQDGSFMVDYLLRNTDLEVFGGARRLSVTNHENIAHLCKESRFHLINFDLTDAHSIEQVVSQLKPDYFVNFAAQSFVKSSWDFPAQTWDANTKSIIHILEAIRNHVPKCRFYNAGSSEEFGNVAYSPQDEKHPLRPRSPYGASKAAARQLVKVYRESYNMYAVQGWLFNHEGSRRGEEFVTRKITTAVARINKDLKAGNLIEPLELGNVDVSRDWSDAEDMVDAVWKMLNQEDAIQQRAIDRECDINLLFPNFVPKEFVVSSGEVHTVKEFVQLAFEHVGIGGKWIEHTDPLKTTFDTPKATLVKINQAFYRPAEVKELWGDSTDIRNELGWNPQISFRQLVAKMVDADVARLQ